MLKGFAKQSYYILRLTILAGFLASLIACSPEPEIKAPALVGPIKWLNRPQNYSLPPFTNKIVLLEFMTNQCPACMEIAPVLKEIQKRYGDKIILLGIYTPFATLPSQLILKEFINKLRIDYPVIYDEQAKIFQQYELNGWPTLVLINNKGRIKKRIYGVKNVTYLNQVIQQAIEGEKI